MTAAALLSTARAGLDAADRIVDAARAKATARFAPAGKIDSAALEEGQFAAHGMAWMATYVETLRQTLGWAERLEAEGRFGALEQAILKAGFGEYLAQIAGGIAMSQVEIARPRDLALSDAELAPLTAEPIAGLIADGTADATLKAIADAIEDGHHFGETGLFDDLLDAMREQMRRFAEERIRPFAQDWHRADVLIPIEVIEEMAELGVFGVTIAEEYGGLGLGKIAICVVTEELSRGWLSVGSIGTRAEIAGELIALAGTDAQKEKWLPALASGAVLPTAVFTEPGTGSDLGSLKTRAVKDGAVYRVTGNKTWTTHGARSDLMTLLVRTDAAEAGYRGLSMFLAEKPRGTDDEPFPAAGMSGTEIPVLGYRGMKEYEIGFDNFEVAADGLLGAAEGAGFKQLMQTFEAARIQTAARAVGVAQSALEIGLAYAKDRVQFGKPIYAFPRVWRKLAWMAAETMMARQLTYFAAREKDAGRRSDMEAGMAKLLAARVAWASADAAVQIHGGNGYAEEYEISRVLCDARILNVFEGAAEIQAQIIARRLLEAGN
jgi:(2S)-methylsuccinyl-CoA dehydrogenase